MSNTLFQWDAKFSVHVKAMDDEHQVLIGLMNDLHKKYEAKASPSDQLIAFKKLADYTVKHFADEEKYMESINYSGLATHRLIHKNLLARVGEFAADFEKQKSFTPELFRFLKTWLAAHIMGVDIKYGAKNTSAAA